VGAGALVIFGAVDSAMPATSAADAVWAEYGRQ